MPLPNAEKFNEDCLESNIHKNEFITPISPTHGDNNNNNINSSDSYSTKIIPSIESHSKIKDTPSEPNQSKRKRRKTILSSKIARPLTKSSSVATNNVKIEKNVPSPPSIPLSVSSTTKTNVTMIFDLIRSLLEKEFVNNNENLMSTIDCLINSLQNLRERIQANETTTIPTSTTTNDNNDEKTLLRKFNNDHSCPLNLSKPKIRNQARLGSTNSDDMSPSATTVSSPSPSTPILSLTSPFLPSQALFYDKSLLPPFSGKDFLSSVDAKVHMAENFYLVPNMTHLQNYLKLTAAPLLNDQIVCINFNSFLIVSLDLY